MHVMATVIHGNGRGNAYRRTYVMSNFRWCWFTNISCQPLKIYNSITHSIMMIACQLIAFLLFGTTLFARPIAAGPLVNIGYDTRAIPLHSEFRLMVIIRPDTSSDVYTIDGIVRCVRVILSSA